MQKATRRCYRCDKARPIGDFVKDKSKASGYASICKLCDRDKGREYYVANREHKLARAKARHTSSSPTNVECSHCGATFQRPPGNRAKYCTPEHRRLAQQRYDRERYDPQRERARNRRKMLRRVAATLAAWSPRPEPRLLTAGPEPEPPRCGRCRTPLEQNARRKYCGPACARHAIADHQRKWYVEHRGSSIAWTAGYCHECHAAFVTRGRSAFCCEAHATRSQRRRAKQIRSKRIATAARREPIDLATVATRDRWQCHICRRKVTRATWSLDHLVPLVHGGDHTYDNVALAHHLCNSVRGADGHAQLRLVA